MSTSQLTRAARPLSSLAGLAANQSAERLSSGKGHRCLLLGDVPVTALPTDVLRALKDAGVVQSDFALSAITSPPPSYPRTPSLTRTYHLTFSSPSLAADAQRQLSAAPLFAATIAARRAAGRARLTLDTAEQWARSQIEAAARALAAGSRAGPPVAARPVDAAWANEPGTKGRRVIIKGLPGKLAADDLAKLARGVKVDSGRDAIRRLPPSAYTTTSVWAITTESVSAAYALTRKIHMNYYNSSVFGEVFLMRAQVAW